MKTHDHNKITESDPYQPDNVPLYEAIYGKNLISLGGLAAIDNMFTDLNIQGLKTRLSNNQAFIKQKYDEELFLIIQKQHEELIEKIQQHQKIATRIVAKKTS